MNSSGINQINHTLSYRRDIDGLRAIAILAVIIFHASPRSLTGGFIGVDIFFVISGYLITTILLKDLNQRCFSVRDFYIRRANRIFPALILMLLAVFTIGWWSLLPDEYAELGKYMAAGAGFISNLALWKDLGYFDTASELKPLLHLWSLGIEEQFYFVWPLALWLGFRKHWNFFSLTIVIMTASYYLSVRGVKVDTSAAFYLPQTRFWELLIGVFIAICHMPHNKNSNGQLHNLLINIATYLDSFIHFLIYRNDNVSERFSALRETASFLGLALIITGLIKLTPHSPFPGKNALWPTLGAALLICGRHTWINQNILSNKILVWVGLISYPLYLWHWPLLSIARIIEQETPSAAIRWGAIGLSFILAAGTFYGLEKPLRRIKHAGRKALILFLLLISTGYLGWNVYHRHGHVFRSNIQKIDNSYSKHYFDAEDNNYFPTKVNKNKPYIYEFERTYDNKKNGLLILGDSHSAHLGLGFSKIYPKLNLTVARFGIPLLNVNKDSTLEHDYDYFSPENLSRQSTVLLSAWWPLYGSTYPSAVYGFQEWPASFHEKSYSINDFSWREQAIRETLTYLLANKKQVIVAYDIPILKYKPSDCFVSRPIQINNKKITCDQNKSDILAAHQTYRTAFEHVLKDFPQVLVFDPLTMFCDEKNCYAKHDGKSLYLDDNHLSMYGSEFYARAFKEKFPDLFSDEE